MTVLTDALEVAIAAGQTLINAQSAFNAAQADLTTATNDFETARNTAFAFFPPELLSYPYTDSNSVPWSVSKDNNPTLTFRRLDNNLPIP